MDNFCNIEYLRERFSAVCKERDDLKKKLHETKSELDRIKAELDALLEKLEGKDG